MFGLKATTLGIPVRVVRRNRHRNQRSEEFRLKIRVQWHGLSLVADECRNVRLDVLHPELFNPSAGDLGDVWRELQQKV